MDARRPAESYVQAMSRTLITPARPVTLRARPHHVLIAGLVAIVAACGAATALPQDDAVLPTKPDAALSAPTIFGDPPVLKGARAAHATAVTPQLFGDPTVRKGAGGQ